VFPWEKLFHIYHLIADSLKNLRNDVNHQNDVDHTNDLNKFDQSHHPQRLPGNIVMMSKTFVTIL
jgi:hypothetical protein